MSDKKWDWPRIERDYIAGKYRSLRDVSEREGMSVKMVQRRSVTHKWSKRRKAAEYRAEEIIAETIARENASEALKARKQILRISNVLITQGIQKFCDSDGKIKPNVITNAQTAITALSAGVKMKMDLYGLREKDDGEGQQNVYQIFQQQNNNSTISFQGVSDAELERIITYGRQRLGIPDDEGGGGGEKKAGGKK